MQLKYFVKHCIKFKYDCLWNVCFSAKPHFFHHNISEHIATTESLDLGFFHESSPWCQKVGNHSFDDHNQALRNRKLIILGIRSMV